MLSLFLSPVVLNWTNFENVKLLSNCYVKIDSNSKVNKKQLKKDVFFYIFQDVVTYGKTNVVGGGGPDLKSLQTLLAIVIAITLTGLILIVVLLSLKVKSSRKKIDSSRNDSVSMRQVSPSRRDEHQVLKTMTIII